MTRATVVALIREVFHDEGAAERLGASLRAARARGAELAILPELPLQHWCPATREPSDDDAEPPAGRRSRLLCRAARAASIALVGGVIVRDGDSHRRHNTALLVDASGEVRGRYEKLHLPDEPGFFETCHYEPGDAPPAVVEIAGLSVGTQICSDINRPQGALLLAAAGADLIVVPRATEPTTFDPWRLVFRAVALTTACYVLSVNRPRPEGGAALGGPSIVVAPDGEVLVESDELLVVATLEPERLRAARAGYPGYLAVRREVYAAGWIGLSRGGG